MISSASIFGIFNQKLLTPSGKNDEALEWLEKAYEERDGNMPYINGDPILDGLRDELRFQNLLQGMNLPTGK